MSEAELTTAVRVAVESHPDGVEAGPKAIHTSLQASDERFKDVGLAKFKKIFVKVKAAIKEDEEKAQAEAVRLGSMHAIQREVGTVENCSGKHGLKRFMTNHSSYCCDTCRCYLAEGAPMWGCRICDWDVCEGTCHPAWISMEELKDSLASLESKADGEISREDPADLKTRLALVEADVHKLERRLDNATVEELCKASTFMLELDEARSQKKVLIKSIEALLQKIESAFEGIK